jgi:hypothetical protein
VVERFVKKQVFGVRFGNKEATMRAITITDDPAAPGIKSGTPSAVWIPAGFPMTWDEADLTPAFGGADAQDDKTITILGDYSYGGLGDSYALDLMLNDKSLDLPAGTTWVIR